jgi:hypothetical protein
MTAVPDTARSVAVVRTLVLADVLGQDLPDPGYIAFSPDRWDISLQFSRTADPLGAVRVWADKFGTEVDTGPDPEDPARVWIRADFTYSDVRFHAYALVGTDQS